MAEQSGRFTKPGLSDNVGPCQALFERTTACTPRRAPFRSLRWCCFSNRGNENGQFIAYTQMTQADIPNYWAYAQNFVLADRMFSSQQGPSFPNHLYTIAAQGGGAISIPVVNGKIPPQWGCDSPSRTPLGKTSIAMVICC